MSTFLMGIIATLLSQTWSLPALSVSQHTQLSASHCSNLPWGIDEKAPYKGSVIFFFLKSLRMQ